VKKITFKNGSEISFGKVKDKYHSMKQQPIEERKLWS